MSAKGFHHIGVATLDLDRTREFYIRALGLPTVCYHYAFDAGTEAALEEKRAELTSKGVEVSPVMRFEATRQALDLGKDAVIRSLTGRRSGLETSARR